MGIVNTATTPDDARASVSDFADLTNGKRNRPEKSLLEPKPKRAPQQPGVRHVRFRARAQVRMYASSTFKRRKDASGQGAPASSTTPTARPVSRGACYHISENESYRSLRLSSDDILYQDWVCRLRLAEIIQRIVPFERPGGGGRGWGGFWGGWGFFFFRGFGAWGASELEPRAASKTAVTLVEKHICRSPLSRMTALLEYSHNWRFELRGDSTIRVHVASDLVRLATLDLMRAFGLRHQSARLDSG